MGLPVVSVIIPVYNKGRCVARTIKSVQAQTMQDFEVIVVDDGSTDDGVAVVSGFADTRIRLVRQANAGPGAARNAGLRESRAPLVAFLDADDEYLPEFLACGMQNLREEPECAMSVCQYYMGPDRQPRGWGQRRGIGRGPWRLPVGLAPRGMNARLNGCFPSTIVGWRELLSRYGGFYDKNRCTYGEDTYLWIVLALNHPLFYDPQPLAWFHSEDSELSTGRKTFPPPMPALTDPEPMRAVCPTELRDTLEGYLFHAAWLKAIGYARLGDWPSAREVMRKLPVGGQGRFGIGHRLVVAALAGAWGVLRFTPGALGFAKWCRSRLRMLIDR